MTARVLIAVAVALVLVAPVFADDDPLDPDVRHGTIVVDGVEIDFWKQGAPVGPGPDMTPEPTTLVLLGLGALALLRKRK